MKGKMKRANRFRDMKSQENRVENGRISLKAQPANRAKDCDKHWQPLIVVR